MNKDAAIKKLQEFKARGCHLLIPTTQHVDSLSDQFEIIIDTVLLSGHPKDRDVYPHEGGYDFNAGKWKCADHQVGNQKVRIAKHGLDKLNITAGMMWSPSMCREIRDPNIAGRIAYEAVGGVRKPDGTPYFISKIYAMDIEVEREKLESLHSGKANKDYCITRDLLQKKSNIATLCESGAKNRVTREILCLENHYTVDDLKKEFVMVRIVPKLDLNDPYTKRRLIDLQLQALTGIYGLPQQQPDRAQIEYSAPIDIKMVKESSEEEPPEPETKPPADETAKPGQPFDFEKLDGASQNTILNDLIKTTGYDINGYFTRCKIKTLDDVTGKSRIGLYEHLLTLKKMNLEDVPY